MLGLSLLLVLLFQVDCLHATNLNESKFLVYENCVGRLHVLSEKSHRFLPDLVIAVDPKLRLMDQGIGFITENLQSQKIQSVDFDTVEWHRVGNAGISCEEYLRGLENRMKTLLGLFICFSLWVLLGVFFPISRIMRRNLAPVSKA